VCGLREALFAVATENKHPSIVKAQSPSNAKRPKEKNWQKKNLQKNLFWQESRSLTFVVQLRFASALILQTKQPSVEFCRIATDQGKPRPY